MCHELSRKTRTNEFSDSEEERETEVRNKLRSLEKRKLQKKRKQEHHKRKKVLDQMQLNMSEPIHVDKESDDEDLIAFESQGT